jgi:hypothetical protein
MSRNESSTPSLWASRTPAFTASSITRPMPPHHAAAPDGASRHDGGQPVLTPPRRNFAEIRVSADKAQPHDGFPPAAGVISAGGTAKVALDTRPLNPRGDPDRCSDGAFGFGPDDLSHCIPVVNVFRLPCNTMDHHFRWFRQPRPEWKNVLSFRCSHKSMHGNTSIYRPVYNCKPRYSFRTERSLSELFQYFSLMFQMFLIGDKPNRI